MSRFKKDLILVDEQETLPPSAAPPCPLPHPQVKASGVTSSRPVLPFSVVFSSLLRDLRGVIITYLCVEAVTSIREFSICS